MRPPEFWIRRDPVSRLLVAILSPLGWLYGSSVAWRAAHTNRYRSRLKVVCVGNLTAGGTGKTPTAMEIGRALIARGARPVFLSRGHGGRAKGPVFVAAGDAASIVGDEPLLLATIAPVIVSRDRAAGAKLAEKSGFDTIIMDDGHQNFSLHKDLSLIVIDAETRFGSERVLPAGPLREPVSEGIQRADAVILNGEASPAVLAQNTLPTIRAHLAPATDESWSGRRVVAFAGIGRPQKFFALLSSLGAQVIEARPFADHHRYTPSELAQLRATAHSTNATLVTTEKDLVRLPPDERHDILTLPVRITFDDRERFERLLDRLVPPGLPPQAQ